MTAAAHIPSKFYDVSGRIGTIAALAKAAIEFVPAVVSGGDEGRICVVAGLLDAQDELLAQMARDIDALEGQLMEIGLHP